MSRVDKTLLQEAVDLIARYGTAHQAAKALGGKIAKTTIYDRYRQGLAMGIRPTDETMDTEELIEEAKGIGEMELLKNQIKNLKKQVGILSKHSITAEEIKRDILNIVDLKDNTEKPEWLIQHKDSSSNSPGVPVLFCSDWHWGEVIDSSQMGNSGNEYNLAIARERVQILITNTIDLLFNHMVNPNYPGLVLILGGDMFSGDIHDELSQSNDQPLMPTMLDLYGVLQDMIAEFRKYFPKIFIVGVTGNHSRTTHKIQHKNRCYTNFDWLMYQFLSKHFKDDNDISFLIPDGPDAYFKVYNHTYLLTHGDQFRGGDGQIGAIGPVLRGDLKKRARQDMMGFPYDTLLLGHFHTYYNLGRIIMNGSLPGDGEYSASGNFSYQLAQQALWINHPLRGITFHMPVQVQEPRVDNGAEWVSVTK